MARDVAILNAAAALFQERGFAAVGVDEIGKQAGVSGPAIYRHFKGKDEILAALFDEGLDDLFRRTGGSFDDPWTELRHVASQHAQFVLENTRLASVCMREGRSLTGSHVRRFQRRASAYLSRWGEMLHRCYPEAEEDAIRAAVYAALGALNAAMDWPKRLKTDDNVELLVDLVVVGVEALGGAEGSESRGGRAAAAGR